MEKTSLLDKEFLSIKELTELYGISRATVYRLMKSGEVDYQKIGGKVLIPTKPIRAKFNLD
ncbi:MAG: Helix-turn-helix domain [Bacteroidota bacterium]|jgi:excisionase family DNA binding protein